MDSNLIAGVPTLNEARLLLEDGEKLNPGPWIEHSLNVGKAAELIAKNCNNLNSDVALVLGMLHDIGYRYGANGIKHTLLGYRFCMEKEYSKAAKISLTHSFQLQDINACFGNWYNCSKEEYDFVKNYLESADYDDYDRLIQLCDSLALASGFCLIEKRMVDVALRHGVNDYTVKKWQATFQLKQYFEEKMGKSIYSVLPDVIENTFQ